MGKPAQPKNIHDLPESNRFFTGSDDVLNQSCNTRIGADPNLANSLKKLMDEPVILLSSEAVVELQKIIVAEIGKDTLINLYNESVPAEYSLEYNISQYNDLDYQLFIQSTINLIVEAPIQKNGSSPILKFLALVEKMLSNLGYKQYLITIQQHLSINLGLNNANQMPYTITDNPNNYEYLLIKISSPTKKIFIIESWLVINNEKHKLGSGSEIAHLRSFSKVFQQLHNEFLQTRKNIIIEIFLDNKWFCYPIDQQEITIGRTTPMRIGIKYPIIIRYLERADPDPTRIKELWNNWVEKWDTFLNTKPSFLEIDKSKAASKRILALHLLENCSVKATFAVPNIQIKEHCNFIECVRDLGIPVAVWLRQPVTDMNIPDNFLDDITTNPANIKKYRLEADLEATKGNNNHYGKHVVILWDNPYRLLPETEYAVKNLPKYFSDKENKYE